MLPQVQMAVVGAAASKCEITMVLFLGLIILPATRQCSFKPLAGSTTNYFLVLVAPAPRPYRCRGILPLGFSPIC